MNSQITLWIALVSGGFALIGSLGSQIISARALLKAKRIELAFQEKVSVYKELITAAFEFRKDPKNKRKLSDFNNAYYTAILLSSDKVLVHLTEVESGLRDVIRKMNDREIEGEQLKNLGESFGERIEKLIFSIRHDLQAGKLDKK